MPCQMPLLLYSLLALFVAATFLFLNLGVNSDAAGPQEVSMFCELYDFFFFHFFSVFITAILPRSLCPRVSFPVFFVSYPDEILVALFSSYRLPTSRSLNFLALRLCLCSAWPQTHPFSTLLLCRPVQCTPWLFVSSFLCRRQRCRPFLCPNVCPLPLPF